MTDSTDDAVRAEDQAPDAAPAEETPEPVDEAAPSADEPVGDAAEDVEAPTSDVEDDVSDAETIAGDVESDLYADDDFDMMFSAQDLPWHNIFKWGAITAGITTLLYLIFRRKD